jgi:hypothetical protein
MLAVVRDSGVRLVLVVGVATAFAACAAQGTDSSQHGPNFDLDSGSNDSSTHGDATTHDAGADVSSSNDATSSNDSSLADSAADSSPADSSNDTSGCTSMAAIVAGSASSLVGAAFGAGQWSNAASIGGSAAFPITVAPIGSVFVAVAVSASDASIRWTAFNGGWSTPAAIGTLGARDAVALAPIGTTLHLVYQAKSSNAAQDYKYFHGAYANGAWDGASDPVGSPQSYGARGPSAASVGGKLVVVQAGSDGFLYDQTWDQSWAAAHQQSGTSLDNTVPPSIVAMNGGAADALAVYARKTDFHFMFVTRTSGAWSAPVEVYNANNNIAYASTPVALAALPGGGAALVYMGGNGKPYASIYSGGAWSAPALLVASGPTVASTPQIAPGVCGDDAIAAYVDAAGGAVNVVSLRGGAWSAPTTIAGANAMTVVGIATKP